MIVGIGVVWTPGVAPNAVSSAKVGSLLESWKGVPYVRNGRDRAGVDCVGFATAFLAELGGVAYTHPVGTTSLDPNVLREAMRALHLRFVDGWACEPGDVLVLRSYQTPECHVGIAGVEPWTMWSAVDGHGVVCTPFRAFSNIVRCRHILRWDGQKERPCAA